MIEAVTQTIKNRLERVKYGESSVSVIDYSPSIDIDLSKIPCYIIYLSNIEEDRVNARTECVVFKKNPELVTIPHPDKLTGGTLTGPKDYTMKPYPTPIKITYSIGMLGTTRNEIFGLYAGLLQSFPPAISFPVNDQNPIFILDHGEVDDIFETGVIRRWQILEVIDVFVERYEKWIIPSIRYIDFKINTGG